MRITMVKKRLASGEPCKKCIQTEEMLRGRGLWDRIDEVAWADENDPDSPGMRLAMEYGIDVAPFFLVDDGGGRPAVYTSGLVLIKERLTGAPPPAAVVPLTPAKGPSAFDVAAARAALDGKGPGEILRYGLERFGAQLAIAFSGAEDVALIDLASDAGLPYSVVTVDTGRLHPETYELIDQVRNRYGCTIHVTAPDAAALEDLVRRKGLFSFYQDGHDECCGVRKVEPLRRALGGYSAWATGQRRDQGTTRKELPIVELDPVFKGTGGAPLVKLNPLAAWSRDEVWAYIRDRGVPYNQLHARGFVSIGCAPCTRAILPGQAEREGRWWWEDAAKKECGLHAGNVRKG